MYNAEHYAKVKQRLVVDGRSLDSRPWGVVIETMLIYAQKVDTSLADTFVLKWVIPRVIQVGLKGVVMGVVFVIGRWNVVGWRSGLGWWSELLGVLGVVDGDGGEVVENVSGGGWIWDGGVVGLDGGELEFQVS